MNFIVPIFSMRSHETGMYDILKDGNFQLHINRASPGDMVVVPTNSVKNYYGILDRLGLTYIELSYPENAYASRKEFWNKNQEAIDLILDGLPHKFTLIVDITGYKGRHPYIFNSNITKDPEVSRPYIDEFIEVDVETVNNSEYTTVLNESQKTTLVANGAKADKISVCTKVIRPGVPELLRNGNKYEVPFMPGSWIFHPFRISDKCYDFERVLRETKEQGYFLVITDPNDSYVHTKENRHVVVIKPSKEEYYSILANGVEIMYHEDPSKVFHPGLAEFIYFNAKIYSDYNMPLINDLVVT